MSSATADGTSFLTVQDSDIKDVVEQVQGDQYLQYTLGFGIGFLYECMNEKDEQVVLNLARIRAISVVVMTHKLAMQHKIKGKNIVVLDC
jgi:allophanate hydrolase subunit 1